MSNIKKVNPYGFYDKALNKHFVTERSKKEYMKAHSIVHDGSMENENKRDERNVAIINDERRKQGLKPKTKQELAGDARRVKSPTLYFYNK